MIHIQFFLQCKNAVIDRKKVINKPLNVEISSNEHIRQLTEIFSIVRILQGRNIDENIYLDEILNSKYKTRILCNAVLNQVDNDRFYLSQHKNFFNILQNPQQYSKKDIRLVLSKFFQNKFKPNTKFLIFKYPYGNILLNKVEKDLENVKKNKKKLRNKEVILNDNKKQNNVNKSFVNICDVIGITRLNTKDEMNNRNISVKSLFLDSNKKSDVVLQDNFVLVYSNTIKKDEESNFLIIDCNDQKKISTTSFTMFVISRIFELIDDKRSGFNENIEIPLYLMDAVIEYVEAALNINNNPQSAKEKLNNLNLIINNFLKTIHSPDFILNNQVGVAIEEKEPSTEEVKNDADIDFQVKPLRKRVKKQEEEIEKKDKFVKDKNIKKKDNKNSSRDSNQINDQKAENKEVNRNENLNKNTQNNSNENSRNENSKNENSKNENSKNENSKNENLKNENSKGDIKKDNNSENEESEDDEEEKTEEEEFF